MRVNRHVMPRNMVLSSHDGMIILVIGNSVGRINPTFNFHEFIYTTAG
jgi:hypothetical protein